MAPGESSVAAERLQETGAEAGTAPADRRFRPDVEGLRAVAILLVVLFHADIPSLTGGFVGVDVFFVISGFVITGVLLRERAGSGRTSILDFYARRCRRILPAASLVIVVTAVATYVVLGVVSGNSTADDGRWAAVFLANFHFEAVGTNYLLASRLPSPLQSYWSLSVEEQFYVVYPSLFMLVVGARSRVSPRARLAFVLGLVIIGSYWFSISQTASHPASAYFSPFTRAWELALGALVAVGTEWLKSVPSRVAAGATWLGLVAIVYSAIDFNAQTAYPGSVVAVPVVGAALVIAGGAAVPSLGAERLLGLSPFRWLGKLSYSLYLWHWPILIIAAERSGGTTLPVGEALLLVLLALAVSLGSYHLVENPVRRWRLPSGRSVAAGVGLVVVTVVVLSVVIAVESGSSAGAAVVPAPNVGVVLRQVAAAPRITTVAASIVRADYGASYPTGESDEPNRCVANFPQTKVPICVLGDPTGRHLMVVYGDSHALMWIPTFDAFAKAEQWKLVVLGKLGCPATRLTVLRPAGVGLPVGPDTQCDAWHEWATKWIDRHHPSLLVFSQADYYRLPIANVSPLKPFSPAQWQQGLLDMFNSFSVPRSRMVFLGTTPMLAQAGPVCLASHPKDVQACSSPARYAVSRLNQADRQAALVGHVRYINTVPWFCSDTCTAIIGNLEVYDSSGSHISGVWARYLQNVVSEALTRPLRLPR
jgi:peptidoglycan/LPS O-acetylase OafA/YrhL